MLMRGHTGCFPSGTVMAAHAGLIEPFALDLADYDDDPIQIITQSIACDYRGHPLEIVEMTAAAASRNMRSGIWKGRSCLRMSR